MRVPGGVCVPGRGVVRRVQVDPAVLVSLGSQFKDKTRPTAQRQGIPTPARRPDGNPFRPLRCPHGALGRSVALLLDGMFFGLTAHSAMKPPLQPRPGDRWYRTIVTRTSSLAGRLPSRSGFGEALHVGLLADGACCLVSAIIKLP